MKATEIRAAALSAALEFSKLVPYEHEVDMYDLVDLAREFEYYIETGKTSEREVPTVQQAIQEITQPVLQNGPEVVFWTPKGSKEQLGDAEANIMRLHNLQENRKPSGELIDFICKGCGQTYVSIQDRTLRPVGPSGCGGCQHKQKWG